MQSFKGREKARRYAMQALYSWQITSNSLQQIEAFYKNDRNPKNYDVAYFSRLLHDVPTNVKLVDEELTQFIDRPFTTLDPIELAILRIAAYEFKFSFDVPYKVVIFEAVELAKVFGATESYKFINSVLDKMARHTREYEINQTSLGAINE